MTAGTVLVLAAGLWMGGDLVSPPQAAASAFATTISAGQTHACMLRGGNAFCWGDNSRGQLGNGSNISSGVPAAVYTGGALSGVTLTSISAGTSFTCALSSAGAVYCWGDNAYGELGSNSAASMSAVPVAVSVSGVLSGKTITEISAGIAYLTGSMACALSSAGAAYCWGSGGLGQLGNNGFLSSSVPVAVYTGGVLSGKTLSQVSAGGGGACVLSTAGAVYCWGYNNVGQVGDNSTTNRAVPVAVYAGGVLSGVTVSQVALGQQDACALSSAGAAYCWGYGPDGELGNNANSSSSVPVAVYTGGVLSGKTLSSISVGNGQTCALSSTSVAYCWGYNANGQIGNSTFTGSNVPVAVTAAGVLSGATLSQVAAGANYTCAVDSSGTAYCWGQNNYGQVGTTTIGNFTLPLVVSPPQASTLGTGYIHACDIRAGKAYCWGDNTDGELGNNSFTSSHVPVAVYTGGVLSGVTLTQIVSGQYFSCAMSTAGTVYCWGLDTSGELGNNATVNSSVPVAVYTAGALSGLTLTQLDPGYLETCVLSSTSKAYCWGFNADGELGNGGTTNSSVPVAVTVTGSSALTGKVIAALYPGDAHSCATDTAGKAYCWGTNSNGALGNNSTTTSTVAVAVSTGGVLSGVYVTAMSSDGGAGDGTDESTCALSSTGAAYCWGYNNAGQLGNNSVSANSLVPVAVYTSGALSGVYLSQITAGYDYACGLSSAGTAYCWGSNASDQLGINNIATTSSKVPLAVYTGGALSGLTLLQISGSPYQSVCVLDTIGAVYCWGANGSGQLGNNSVTSSDVAVQVVNQVPGAPTSVTSFPASGSASVYWAAPASFGSSGSATGYTVTATTAGASGATCTSSGALTCTLTGLTNGTTYTVTVVTNTTGGPSYASSSATVTAWPPDTAIATAYGNTCTLQSGRAYCWGDNTSGEAGIGTTATPQLSPVAVSTSGVLSGVTLTQVVTGSQAATGNAFACGLSSTGLAYCWGNNTYGQLGNGTNTSSTVPVAVSTSGVLSGVTLTQISTERFSVCALSSTGAVYCWGDDTNGQLGNNASGTTSNVPVAVTTSGTPMAGVTVVQVSAGWLHSCALGSNAAVYCWGDGSSGDLGNNSTANSNVPVAVYTGGALSGGAVASIAAGYLTTCALLSNGAPYCWGQNAYGQLGNNSNTNSSVPVQVSSSGVLFFKRVTQISVGVGDVCALDNNGVGYCWGQNGNGQLGNNSTTSSNVPVLVSTSGALSGATLTQVSVGIYYACALSSAGTAYCWGNGQYGELGNNNSSASSSTAVLVTPQAPLSLTTTPGDTTLAVSWTAPTYLNTGTLTSYTATASPGGATCTSPSATSCTLTGLTDGTTYTITATTTATTSGTSAPSIAATGTPIGLQMTAPASLTWSSTVSGLNSSVVDGVLGDQQLTVNDSSGSGAGWHITMSATTVTTGSRTLPNSSAVDVNGSVTSLTGVAPSAACVSSCTLPTNTTTYPVAITTAATSPSSYTIYDTSASTGIGAVTIGGSGATHPVGWWVNVPSSAYAGSYTSTVTLTLVSGP